VTTWAGRYGTPDDEVRLIDEVGSAVRARGWFEPDEFAAVAAWKTPRSKPRVAANAADDVRAITRLALTAPEHLQHRVLTLLQGVQEPTATALLAVVLPERHTVFDVRAADALARVGEWDGLGGYPAYLAACRRVARRTGVDLRTLDRALWQWSKAGYPPR
jgi:hypothetical protein